MDIIPANRNQPWEHTLCPLCPSCAQVHETCSHILFCNKKGRVDAMMKSINLLSSWMMGVNTDPDLRECIVEYAKGRGTITMLRFAGTWTLGFGKWHGIRMKLAGKGSWREWCPKDSKRYKLHTQQSTGQRLSQTVDNRGGS
jgi:hypothetical protein